MAIYIIYCRNDDLKYHAMSCNWGKKFISYFHKINEVAFRVIACKWFTSGMCVVNVIKFPWNYEEDNDAE